MSAVINKPIVNVAVAVVQRSDGRVLLAERPREKVSGGFWEFPGGKFNAGESAENALARELNEEVGIILDKARPWLSYEYSYPDKFVHLHFFRITAWHGTPHGREGQRISWEDPAAVNVAPLLPANDKILQALKLPAVYGITNTKKYGVSGFLTHLGHGLNRGVRLIQVRETSLSPEQLSQFALRIIAQARVYGARVLLNSEETLARRVGADGVHSSAKQLMRLTTRPNTGLWAASCHHIEELSRAAKLGADFVVLSQVLPTTSHPGELGIGWQRFAEWINAYPLPVYALGGMKLDLLDAAINHGAHGIALRDGVW